jgi:hypothetical protein
MSISTAAPPVVDQHVFLIGRPPISEFLSYVRNLAVNARTRDEGELMEEWRVANDRVRELETAEAGIADDPPVQLLPEAMRPLADAVLADPQFKQAFRLVRHEIVMVELDRMVVFQKHINLMHVDAIRKRLPERELTPEELFDLCIPLDVPTVPVRIAKTAPNSFTFVSPSRDFRYVEPVLLDPSQVSGYDRMGPVTAILGIVVGYGSNYLNAIHAEGRLVLTNGSHRAYALREHGITHVPCIVQDVTRAEELEMVGADEVRHHPDRYLQTPRPPMLKDYFDDRLRKILHVARKHRMITLTFGVDVSDIPGE